MGFAFDFGFEGNAAVLADARLAFFFLAEGDESALGKERGPLALADASRYVEFFEMQGEVASLAGGVYAELCSSDEPGQNFWRQSREMCQRGALPVVVAGERFRQSKSVANTTVCLWGVLGSGFGQKTLLGTQQDTVLVGVRAATREAFAELGNHVTMLTAEELWRGRDRFREVVSSMTGPVHLSLDLDVFDQATLGAILSPEPGGLAWYDVVWIIEELMDGPGVLSVDVVAAAHVQPRTRAALLGAQLLTKIAALHQARVKVTSR